MILSDNETKVDLLNSEPIARTIVKLVTKNPERPITIGVHGDWGAGKSSVLEMVDNLLSNEKDIVCIKFNGWRFQGFEDAKIALLEGIVAELVEKRSLTINLGIAIKDIYKRIDWLKVAKKTGGLAFTLLSGIPHPDTIQTIVSGLQAMAGNPKDLATKENFDKAIANAQSILKPQENSNNIPEEISEFRKEFDKLLEQAGIKQLIVLIDDLDRCLPETSIETLEAIRLFVFTTKTAFVIAADEGMIEYAVRRHFPDLSDLSESQNYSRNYLEKLIQVPFRIPTLGIIEAKIYVTLLLIGDKLGDNSESFIKLIDVARDRLKKPWESKVLEPESIKKILKERFDEVQNVLLISDQIGEILTSGTRGNPRQIKRFLNTLLLRQEAAVARGFSDMISLPVLAKLMIAERYIPRLFEQIAEVVSKSDNGTCEELESFETVILKEDFSEKSINNTALSDGLAKEWLMNRDILDWGKLLPKLSKVDLRPYIFISQEKKNFFNLNLGLGHLASLAEKLLGPKIAVQSLNSEIKALTISQGIQLFEALKNRVTSLPDLSKEPPGIQGMMVIVKSHPQLQLNLVEFLGALPIEKIGPWVVAGWDSILVDYTLEHKSLVSKWANTKSNKPLQIAASSTQKLAKK